MTQIISHADSVTVGTTEYPVNCLTFDTQADINVAIRRVSNGGIIVDYGKFDTYVDNTGTPYASYAALITALRAAFFKVLS